MYINCLLSNHFTMNIKFNWIRHKSEMCKCQKFRSHIIVAYLNQSFLFYHFQRIIHAIELFPLKHFSFSVMSVHDDDDGVMILCFFFFKNFYSLIFCWNYYEIVVMEVLFLNETRIYEYHNTFSYPRGLLNFTHSQNANCECIWWVPI